MRRWQRQQQRRRSLVIRWVRELCSKFTLNRNNNNSNKLWNHNYRLMCIESQNHFFNSRRQPATTIRSLYVLFASLVHLIHSLSLSLSLSCSLIRSSFTWNADTSSMPFVYALLYSTQRATHALIRNFGISCSLFISNRILRT